MIDIVNIEQLCDEVNRILETRRITVSDARTASVVSPRNVRYYRTIGLMEPPIRRDGRAMYEQVHIDQIVAIKEAQQDGITLEELIEQRKRTELVKSFLKPSLHLNAMTTDLSLSVPTNSHVPEFSYSSTTNKISKDNGLLGWSVHFDSTVLSGQGTPPTPQQLAAIRKILELREVNEE
jgi:hypothetical protein